MAKLAPDKKSVIVEKGDTLWGIASEYLGSGSKYQALANKNNIKNPSKISVGQKIYIADYESVGTVLDPNKLYITEFGLQSNSDNVLYASWSWGKENTAGYVVEWTYETGGGMWFVGNTGTINVDEHNEWISRQSTYTIPANARQVRFKVKPISKTYTQNGNETRYWTEGWSESKLYTDTTPLTTPSVPTVSIDKYNLTAKLENINIADADSIEFHVYKDDGSAPYKTGKANITATNSVSFSCTVDAGGSYKVCCRACGNDMYSSWSNFSEAVITVPAASSGITTIKANSSTSVYLEWDAAESATSYDVEYATKKEYFDGSDLTSRKTDIEFTHYEITGLESGEEYFFRVRAVNSQGESPWSELKSVVIGKKPSAPTTWSSTTTCVSGEELILYWVHNALDGSDQTYAELELYINDVMTTHTIKSEEKTDEDGQTGIQSYTIDTAIYVEGTKIQWRVRTSGVTNEYGDWSIQRTVDIYAPPTLELRITDIDENVISTLNHFPFCVYALPGPKTQTPLSYHLSVTADDSYVTVDNVGNEITINAGDEVYSKYFDVKTSLLVELSAGSINLDNNINYTVTCIVSMNSGLTATATKPLSVSWVDDIYMPNAEIGYDEERYVTHIRPYCMEYKTTYHKVDYDFEVGYVATDTTIDGSTIAGVYTETDELVYIGNDSRGVELYYCTKYFDNDGNPIDQTYYKVTYSSGVYTTTSEVIDISTITKVVTTTGESVSIGLNELGDEIYYCSVSENRLVDDITLSVYRREFDGSFTELATGLNNTSNTYITDPHPALDYGRYRVVATTNSTGSVSYYDVPGYPIGEPAVIIQWDEVWSNFDISNEDEMTQPPWTGSLLRLPYNIDVSDSNELDVTLVKYIGRKRPVSYYGTQLGEKSIWNVDVVKNDKETLYGLRRLAIWGGDVYVREPSGSGYWASVSVSFSQKHRELTIPVTLDITRVEGGV